MNPNLKALAASILTTLQHHLEMSKEMDAHVDGDGGATRMSTDGGRGSTMAHPMVRQ